MSEPTLQPWLACPRPNPEARLRLFCFPHAGGGSSGYHTWWTHLPADLEVCAIQLPGRESRLLEPAFTSLPPLVQVLAHILQPYMRIPFAFFGHSMGALVSFELARLLRRQNKRIPVHLAVSAHRAPQRPAPAVQIHQLSRASFIAELRSLNGTQEEILENAELMELVLPPLRADMAVCETYAYTVEEPLACPISVYGGTEDNKISKEDLIAWHAQTCGTFNLRMFAGDHFFVHNVRSAFLHALAHDMTQLMEEQAMRCQW